MSPVWSVFCMTVCKSSVCKIQKGGQNIKIVTFYHIHHWWKFEVSSSYISWDLVIWGNLQTGVYNMGWEILWNFQLHTACRRWDLKIVYCPDDPRHADVIDDVVIEEPIDFQKVSRCVPCMRSFIVKFSGVAKNIWPKVGVDLSPPPPR